MEKLIQTETNSSNESKGRVFGLSGNNYLFLIFSFVISLGVLMLLHFGSGIEIFSALIIVSPIFFLPMAFVIFLREGKPNGYAVDFLENLIFGANTKVVLARQPKHPREKYIEKE